MNLVAKEFVAARDDEKGVLVLSSFTGASRELSQALIVNPYYTQEMSSAIDIALRMPLHEQQERMHLMRQQVHERNVYRWAGKILSAAGFDREDIAHFFRQAADQLAPQSPRAEAPPRSARADMAPVHAAFRQSKPVADLQPLIAQARALPPLGEEGPQLKTAFDLAMQMSALLAEAQNGLRALAKDASLPVYASREELRESDPSESTPALCLEDFEPAYRGAFEAIGAVLEELLRREDAEAFTFLLGHLAENGVAIDGGLRAAIEKAARLLPG
jgi:hypothetical protein